LLLKGKNDMYSGITIDLTKCIEDRQDENYLLICSKEIFDNSLKESIAHWRQNGVRGVCLALHITQSELITIAVKHGFVFHHTEPNCIYLTLWLPDETVDPCKLPAYCQHYIGAGGCVLSIKQRKILMVTEKYEYHRRKAGENVPFWKIPGGQMDNPDESIGNAAVREVKEETGVDTIFVSLLCFRHMNAFRFNKSDIFFVCLLKPVDEEILQEPHPDPQEINLCRWVDFDEYFNFTHFDKMQQEIRKAVKAYLEDNNKCMKCHDISEYGRNASIYTLI
jgi:ADP-ribose pyrophosphatase YjhB (NUDIX family)